jgi:NADPH:quinone reductase-like Zn-dependent oxidoreductase
MSEAWAAQTVAIDYDTEDLSRAIRDWSAEGVDVVVDVAGSTTSPHGFDMLRPGGRLVTATADSDVERDRKEAEERVLCKITFIIDFERAQESMRQITNLMDAGSVHVPPINVLARGEAALAHQMIGTGHVRGKLVPKVAEF